MQHIERIVAAGQFVNGEGAVERLDVTEPYLNCILSKAQPKRRLKVVVDGGNGAAGPLAVRALELIGCEVIPLYCEPDGTFPNHAPDPLEEENVAVLKRMVAEQGAYRGAGAPIKLDRTPATYRSTPPRLGEHTEEVLKEVRPGSA